MTPAPPFSLISETLRSGNSTDIYQLLFQRWYDLSWKHCGHTPKGLFPVRLVQYKEATELTRAGVECTWHGATAHRKGAPLTLHAGLWSTPTTEESSVWDSPEGELYRMLVNVWDGRWCKCYPPPKLSSFTPVPVVPSYELFNLGDASYLWYKSRAPTRINIQNKELYYLNSRDRWVRIPMRWRICLGVWVKDGKPCLPF